LVGGGEGVLVGGGEGVLVGGGEGVLVGGEEGVLVGGGEGILGGEGRAKQKPQTRAHVATRQHKNLRAKDFAIDMLFDYEEDDGITLMWCQG
jgi:hypothetical protein